MTAGQIDRGARLLVLCRHGESEGNRQGIFTGWLDLPLPPAAETSRSGRGTYAAAQRVPPRAPLIPDGCA